MHNNISLHLHTLGHIDSTLYLYHTQTLSLCQTPSLSITQSDCHVHTTPLSLLHGLLLIWWNPMLPCCIVFVTEYFSISSYSSRTEEILRSFPTLLLIKLLVVQFKFLQGDDKLNWWTLAVLPTERLQWRLYLTVPDVNDIKRLRHRVSTKKDTGKQT